MKCIQYHLLWIYHTFNMFTLMSSSPKTPCKELFFLFAEKETEAEGKQRGCPRMEMWYLMKLGYKLNLAESQDHMTRRKIKI